MDVYNPKKTYKSGLWTITRKIDGVQVVYGLMGEPPTSRSGKPLYNLPASMPPGSYECYMKAGWDHTVSRVRSHNGEPIEESLLYALEPEIDARLKESTWEGPMDKFDEFVQATFQFAKQAGYEGLVLRGPNGERLKVKDKVSYDVVVLRVIEGNGKHKGRMGALETPMGKVGTGFSDAEREYFWDFVRNNPHQFCNEDLVIEVECMELTPDGKFRHPRFVRLREDK